MSEKRIIATKGRIGHVNSIQRAKTELKSKIESIVQQCGSKF